MPPSLTHTTASPWSRVSTYTKRHLNFFRIHLLLLYVQYLIPASRRKLLTNGVLHSTFAPLILSAIFYACNGKYHVSYVDALFVCVSASTVTGLATIDLSELTAWQQVIIFFQMCAGSPVRSLPFIL